MDTEQFQAWSSCDGDGPVIVCFAGELDLAFADVAKRALLAVVTAGGPPIVVDVSGLTFIDAAGIRSIVAAQTAARLAEQPLRLVGARGVCEMILELLGLIEVDSPRRPVRAEISHGG